MATNNLSDRGIGNGGDVLLENTGVVGKAINIIGLSANLYLEMRYEYGLIQTIISSDSTG